MEESIPFYNYNHSTIIIACVPVYYKITQHRSNLSFIITSKLSVREEININLINFVIISILYFLLIHIT